MWTSTVKGACSSPRLFRESEVTQLSPSLREPMDCNWSPTRLLCPWDFPGKNAGVGCHFLLQEILPTQGLNPGLLNCRQMLYRLSHREARDVFGVIFFFNFFIYF